MPIFFAAVGTPLYDLAAGALLGANVYLMIRGGKGYLKHRLTRAHREKQLKMSCQALHNAPPNRT